MDKSQEITSSNIQKLQDRIAELEAQLKDKNLVFNSIVESRLAGYWDWRIQENSAYMSPALKKMFGYGDHEIENTLENWQALIHPEDVSNVFEIVDDHFKSRGDIPVHARVRYKHKSGDIIWVLCRAKVVEWDKNWNPIRMIGVHVDISNLKLSENNLKLQKEKTERKNLELEQLAYVVSHDLKSPLANILGLNQVLRNKLANTGSADVLKIVNYIDQTGTRMDDLIKDILNFATLGEKKIAATVNCNDLLQKIIDDLHTQIVRNAASVSFSEMPTIVCFPTELRQLFQNLISNALKFTRPGVKPEIKIDVKELEKHWRFSVIDNGIGIDQTDLEQVFFTFHRSQDGLLEDGNGIGLAICQKIAGLHGGEISVSSEKDTGSNFQFTVSKNL